MFDILVVGGGLSGTRSALECATVHPRKRIALFEKRTKILSDLGPAEPFSFGGKSLTRTQWLRVLKDSPIEVFRSSGVDAVRAKNPIGCYEIETRRSVYQARHVILACGKEADSLKMVSNLGLDTRSLQAAAFALQTEDPRISSIKAEALHVSVSWVKSGPPRKRIHIRLASELPETQALKQTEGLITIRSGIVSGDAIEQLTSYIVRKAQPIPEHLRICINWAPDYSYQGILEYLHTVITTEALKTVFRTRLFELPGALWSRLVAAADIDPGVRWQDLLPIQFQELATQLSNSQFVMKPDLSAANITSYRGGVNPDELHPDRPESKKLAGLYLVGAILDNEVSATGGPDPDGAALDLTWIREID